MSPIPKAEHKTVLKKVVDHTLRTCNELEGLNVYDRRSFSLLGVVTDICFSQEGTCLGFVMEEKRRFYHHRSLLPLPSVTEIKSDGIYVDFSEFKPMQIPKQSFSYDQLKQKMVKNGAGDTLGILEDVYFSSDSGIIVAYELSDGFFADLSGDKKHVQPSGEPLEVGRSTIVLN
ncbi:PRC-barrel domain-containing protein [Bacillus sonorensis]|mgnify:FL=1|nr:PRC-barrel domain-containing protein [Bacillus sonorensis]